MSSQGVAEENPHRKHQRNAKADTWKKNKTVIKNGEDTFEFNLHSEERGGIQPGMGKQFHAVRLPQKVSALAEYWSAGNPFQHELY